MVTPFGLTRNMYWSSVQSEVTAEDLFGDGAVNLR
jgi:hypothetical protein